MLEDINSLDSKEVETAASEKESFKKVFFHRWFFKNGGGGDAMQSKKVLVEVENLTRYWLLVRESWVIADFVDIDWNREVDYFCEDGTAWHQIYELLSSYCVVFRSHIN